MMTHWLELTLTSTAAYFAGWLSCWLVWRGSCRSCRIKHGITNLALPVIEWLYGRKWTMPLADLGLKGLVLVLILNPIKEMLRRAGPHTRATLAAQMKRSVPNG